MKNLNISTLLFAVMMFLTVNLYGQSKPIYFGSGALANPNPIELTQADGTTLTIQLKGDAVINWAVSTDGYTLLRNARGIYEYATLDSYGNLIPSGIKATNVNMRNSNEKAAISSIPQNLFYSDKQIAEKRANTKIGKGEYGKMGGFPTTGTPKLLMILANFSNTATTYTQTNFSNYMNQVNYNSTGSFKDYYKENSYNALDVTTTVTVWVKVPNNHDYYGPDAKWAEFVRDAVNAADAAGINFADFDNDGDGNVDGVAVIHQGPGQEETSNTTDIWSHNWSLSAGGFSVVKDGKTIDAYTCQPEKSGTGMATIGVMCHEFGHNLGLPDFYDTNYSTGGSYNGTGNWDMMASGSYNGSPGGSKPAHHNAWSKIFMNWVTMPTAATTAQDVTLNNAAFNKNFFRFNTATSNEYFLCENRQKVGFDASLPGDGLIIYHVDGNYINTHMNANDINATSRQGLYPKAAGGSINSSTCPFPTASLTSFTDATTPNSKSWAGAATNKPITVITEASQVITFKFMGGAGGTTVTAPTVTTTAATSITTTGATTGGNITANGGGTITAAGVCYATTANPTTANSTVTTATTSGAFTSTLSGLASGTTYYVRAYATNSAGTSYGTQISFTTTTSGGGSTAVALPITENFNSSAMPANWSTSNTGTSITERWSISNTANAGGTAYEAKCSYQQVNPGTTRLITPKFTTGTNTTINISAKYLLDDYATGATMRVQYSTDKTNWTNTTWSLASAANSNKTGTISINQTLAANTDYYVAFVVDGNLYQIDYFYIDNVSITGGAASSVTAPTVTTNTVSAITTTTATCGGNVTADGGASVTARGICWATTANPTTANSKTTDGTGTGAFTSSITGLTAGTTYYVRAYATNSAGTSYGTQQTFTTTASGGGTVTYCASKGNSVAYEWIDYVAIGTLAKTTATKPTSGYSDFTATTAPILTKGSTYTLYVSAGFASSTYTEYFKVYIDYNKNGVFTDAGELVASITATAATNYSKSIVIPTTATTGTTRMRVVMSDNSGTTSCNAYSYGETEDYTVNISATKSDEVYSIIDAEEGFDRIIDHISVFPTPANEVVNININSKNVSAKAIFYNINGQEVRRDNLTSNTNEINISELPAGVYTIKIDDGAKLIEKKLIKQ